MAGQNPIPDQQDRNVEEPGDTNSADIVGRTGEQMPKQSHDGVESVARDDGRRATGDDKTPEPDDRRDKARNSSAADF